MNEELRKMLDSIKAKKQEVRNLCKEGKVEDAEKAKKELIGLQAQFDLLYDLEQEKLDDMQQKADLQVSITKNADTITIKPKNAGGKPYTVRLVNVQAASASGAAMTVDGKDTILTPEADTVTVTL